MICDNQYTEENEDNKVKTIRKHELKFMIRKVYK